MQRGKIFLLLLAAAPLVAEFKNIVANETSHCGLMRQCESTGDSESAESEEHAMLQVSQLAHEVRSAFEGAEEKLHHIRSGLVFREQSWVISYATAYFVIALLSLLPLSKFWAEESSSRYCRTNLLTVSLYYLWLFGGLWVFCFQLKFQSNFWKGAVPLEWPTAVYLMIQIVLTIGFGDITPATEYGRLFMAFYVVVSLFVVADILMTGVGMALDRLSSAESTVMETIAEAVSPTSARSLENRESEEKKEELKPWYEEASQVSNVKAFVMSAVCFLSIVFVGTHIMHDTVQHLSWVDAFYFCVVFSSTVGFGDFSLTTRVEQAYGTILMCMGVAAFANMGLQFGMMLSSMQARDKSKIKAEKAQEKLEALLFKSGKEDRLNADAFLRLSLQQAGLVTAAQLDKIDQIFNELDVDNSGKVDKAKIRDGLVPASMTISS